MKYAITFGQKYRREPHPILGEQCDPDGFVVIDAANDVAANELGYELFGFLWSHARRYETEEERQEVETFFPNGPIDVNLSDLPSPDEVGAW